MFICFTPFCINAPCHFTPLLNLCLFIFGLTSVRWLCSVVPNPYNNRNMIFICAFFIYAQLFRSANRHQTRAACVRECRGMYWYLMLLDLFLACNVCCHKLVILSFCSGKRLLVLKSLWSTRSWQMLKGQAWTRFQTAVSHCGGHQPLIEPTCMLVSRYCIHQALQCEML